MQKFPISHREKHTGNERMLVYWNKTQQM